VIPWTALTRITTIEGWIMRTLVALTLAGLIGISCWAHRAHAALADDDLSGKGGAVLPIPSVTLILQGTLQEGKPDDRLAAGSGPHIYPGDYIIPPQFKIVVNGQSYYLDFGKDGSLVEKARKLVGKRLRLSGHLETHDIEVQAGPYPAPYGRPDILVLKRLQVLRLTEWEAVEDPNAKDELRADVIGKLHLTMQQVGCGPIPSWEIEVGKETYQLQFDNDEAREEAAKHVDKLIVASGTPKEGVVIAKSLQLAIGR
jgi:hypothetical protein